MDDCLFCKIIAGDIPSTKVYEDDDVFAFRDINPQAPVHVLVAPKKHICCADAIDASNSVCVASVINNCGEDGGQTVMHLHFHLLGGVELGEKVI